MIPLLALLAGPALAQSTATLREGDSLLAPCLADTSCAGALLGLLSENMAEVGFLLQVDPLATSALGGKGVGPVAELRFDTAALGQRNALEQLVLLPPGLPRVAVGYQHGSYTYDDPYPQLAVGLTVLPPFQVLGGSVFAAQGDVSAALPVVVPVLWVGGELGYGYGQVAAPVLGSRDQLEAIGAFGAFLPEPGTEACAELGVDCLDQLRQHAVHARIGVSLEPVPAVFAVVRGAVVGTAQRLDVAYDRTRWGAGWVSPQGQVAVGVRAGDQFQLALGGVLAPRPDAQDTTGNPTFAKVEASTSFRIGPRRYWERDEPATGPAPGPAPARPAPRRSPRTRGGW